MPAARAIPASRLNTGELAIIDIWHPIVHSIAITGFVFVMMVVVECATVVSKQVWRGPRIAGRGQHAAGAAMGSVPGCLGAFAAAVMHSRGVISFGALLAAMVATVGDEAFLMLALIPGQFIILAITLFLLGTIAGTVVDLVLRPRSDGIETDPDAGSVPPWIRPDLRTVAALWRRPSRARVVFSVVLGAFGTAVAVGWLHPVSGGWIHAVTVVAVFAGLAIVVTGDERFLIERLYRHVVRRHLPRIFAWTSGALILTELIAGRMDPGSLASWNGPTLLMLACLLGLLPESGPQVLFVTLFHRGLIPFSVLLAGSIVQDGHGMLPVLAQSRRTFVLIKGIKLTLGLAVGFAGLASGWYQEVPSWIVRW